MDNTTLSAAGVAASMLLLLTPALGRAQGADGWQSVKTDAGVTLTPPDLGAGETFAFTVGAPIPLRGEAIQTWLASRTEKEVAALGNATDTAKIVPLGKPELGAFLLVRAVKLASGEQRVVGCFAAPRPGGTVLFGRIVSSSEPGVYKKYLPVVMRAFLAAATTPDTGTTHNTAQTTHKTHNTHTSDNYTKPGIGVNRTDVVGIFLRFVPQFNGYGGAMTMGYQPTVVFKDGTYFEDFDVPLVDFDRQAARVARPDAWGKWRKVGGTFQEFDNKKGWENVKWLGPFPGGKPGEKLTGRYTSFTGGGDTAVGGGNAYAVSGGIVFSPDGRFSTDRSVSFSAESADVHTTGSSRNGKEGTYTLDGTVLTLKFGDGHTERRAFVFMDDDGKRDGFFLDGTGYTRKTK